MKSSVRTAVVLAGAALAAGAWAKLPPLSDEAKLKAAETAAKTAWTNKVTEYQQCKVTDRLAERYLAEAKAAGKAVSPVPTPPCADPGPFVFTPPDTKPLEAAGAHSPPGTATSPPNTTAPASVVTPTPKK